jgi:hypothetical protein|tara:strand:+ start:314 stop:469 length:156 start_codon:yes stop_codon:yes gene_type:complete
LNQQAALNEPATSSYADQELIERPLDLWDPAQRLESVRDDDLNDMADLPWE